ncbi:MAG: hypothetical protein M1820_004032 [Bogoriella megaspora]|nr:MAG: hypothetical protein M1820_004032 [Bogoriella megaspora]
MSSNTALQYPQVPTPAEPPTRSRMASMQDNVRSLLRGSIHSVASIASSIPIPRGSPKIRIPIPQRARSQQSDEEASIGSSEPDQSRAQPSQSPISSVASARAPLPEPPPPTYLTRIVTPSSDILPEDEPGNGSVESLVLHRSKRRQKKAWKRRRGGGDGGRPHHHHRPRRPQKKKTRAKGLKQVVCLSGLLLVIVLAIYLSLALTHPNLNQEIHVLFILVILAITVFFAHSLIRLLLVCTAPPGRRHRRHHHNFQGRIPSMTGPEGFRPESPIRVHLARDEEALEPEEWGGSPELGEDSPSPASQHPPEVGEMEERHDNRTFDGLLLQKEVETKVAGPPPAYGLWRSSVRADPNLLHWQLNPAASAHPSPALGPNDSGSPHLRGHPGVSDGAGSGNSSDVAGVPRPPSYMSDDGVTYVVDAERTPRRGGLEMVQRG